LVHGKLIRCCFNAECGFSFAIMQHQRYLFLA
jgi:hypothetical protein